MKCKNCGAPLPEHGYKCEYCQSWVSRMTESANKLFEERLRRIEAQYGRQNGRFRHYGISGSYIPISAAAYF